jgi:hypothetical protein
MAPVVDTFDATGDTGDADLDAEAVAQVVDTFDATGDTGDAELDAEAVAQDGEVFDTDEAAAEALATGSDVEQVELAKSAA